MAETPEAPASDTVFYLLADADGATGSGVLDPVRFGATAGEPITVRGKLGRPRKRVKVHGSRAALVRAAGIPTKRVWPFVVYEVSGRNVRTDEWWVTIAEPRLVRVVALEELLGLNGRAVLDVLERLDNAHSVDVDAVRRMRRDSVKADIVLGPGGSAFTRTTQYREGVQSLDRLLRDNGLVYEGMLVRTIASTIAGVRPTWLETIQGAGGDNFFGHYAVATMLGDRVPAETRAALARPIERTLLSPPR